MAKIGRRGNIIRQTIHKQFAVTVSRLMRLFATDPDRFLKKIANDKDLFVKLRGKFLGFSNSAKMLSPHKFKNWLIVEKDYAY